MCNPKLPFTRKGSDPQVSVEVTLKHNYKAHQIFQEIGKCSHFKLKTHSFTWEVKNQTIFGEVDHDFGEFHQKFTSSQSFYLHVSKG